MNIHVEIAEGLWLAIQTKYEAHDYTGAIQDAMYYLSNFIREKTGLQSDGVPSIGQAFGGKVPKLRVNSLQTESDINVQKGTENLLIGLFQSIRNPRSHEKHNDSKNVADPIIIFVNYLLTIIGASKGAFSKTEFLDRVFDPSFVESQRYALLLVDAIPPRYTFDVMVDVYRRKEELSLEKLRLFTSELLKKFDEADLSRIAEIVSDDLHAAEADESVRFASNMFPPEFWSRLDETAKMRSENRFIDSIKEGEYIVASKKCVRGSFGTWGNGLLKYFTMKEDCLSVLISKLNSKKTEQDYVFQFFPSALLYAVDEIEGANMFFREWAADTIIDGLKAGDKRFFELSKSAINYHPVFWKESLKEVFDNFQEAGEVPVDKPNDLPF